MIKRIFTPYPCQRYRVDLAISITLLDIRMVEPKKDCLASAYCALKVDFWVDGCAALPLHRLN
jgi:hypothetical protein